MQLENSLPYCAWSFFTKKFFLGFLFGSTKGTPKQYSALKQEDVLVRDDLAVVIRSEKVEAEGRRKVEDRRKALVDEKKNNLLGCSGSWTLSLAFIGVYFHCQRNSGRCFWSFLDFVGLCTVEVSSPLVGFWVLLNLDYGTSRRNVKLVRVSLGHHNREPYLSPSQRWCFALSLSFLDHGNIFWIGKGWVLEMEILDNKMYQSCTGWQTSVVTWIPKGHK